MKVILILIILIFVLVYKNKMTQKILYNVQGDTTYFLPEFYKLFYEINGIIVPNKNYDDAIIYANSFGKSYYKLNLLYNSATFNSEYTNDYLKAYLQSLKDYRLHTVNSLEALIILFDTRLLNQIEQLKYLIDTVNYTMLEYEREIYLKFNLKFYSMKAVPYKKSKNIFIN